MKRYTLILALFCVLVSCGKQPDPTPQPAGSDSAVAGNAIMADPIAVPPPQLSSNPGTYQDILITAATSWRLGALYYGPISKRIKIIKMNGTTETDTAYYSCYKNEPGDDFRYTNTNDDDDLIMNDVPYPAGTYKIQVMIGIADWNASQPKPDSDYYPFQSMYGQHTPNANGSFAMQYIANEPQEQVIVVVIKDDVIFKETVK